MPKPKPSGPWLPAKYGKPDVVAFKAMRAGNASADQQQRVMDFILIAICQRDGMSFRPGPDGDRETAFAEGKRYVANQIMKLMTMPLSQLFNEEKPK